MVFGLCCQREGLYKSLYIVHIFILVGVMYYYFQKSVGKTAPDSELAGESLQFLLITNKVTIDVHVPIPRERFSFTVGTEQRAAGHVQPIGETLRPVWGLMDKCYPATTQRHRVNTGKKQDSGERTRYQQGAAACPSEVENTEERPGSWGPQLLRKFWASWFPAIDSPKMQNHE